MARMRTSLGALALAALLSACGGSTADEATLRAQLREEVRAEMEAEAAQAARRNQPQQVDVEMPDVERYLVDTAHAPARGASAPLVTIVTFSDFQCPFCGRVQPTLERLLRAHPDELQLVFRNNPLPFHQEAMPAAEAAMEVFAQGGSEKFWAYHDLLFANQRELNRENLERFAQQVGGINMTRFRAALDNNTHRASVQADMEAVTEAGARIGTPSFFINGRLVQGAQPFPAFQAAIDQALEAD